jgi:1-acyl-sn-glycerol-3-phosphate acyltransferase
MTDASDTESVSGRAPLFPPTPGPREIFRRPFPHQKGRPLTRFLTKAFLALYRNRYVSIDGLEHVQPANDPFILVANHNQRPEVVLIPAALFFSRDGKPIHFMADWNFKLIPGVAILYSCGQIITVDRKSAKPKFLNVFRPMLTDKLPAGKRAEERLNAGSSIGLYPEGKINRDPDHLLKGQPGAAQLSLKTGAAIVPMGIRFPNLAPGELIHDRARMSLTIGAPMKPPRAESGSNRGLLRGWHQSIMSEISRLSGKKLES